MIWAIIILKILVIGYIINHKKIKLNTKRKLKEYQANQEKLSMINEFIEAYKQEKVYYWNGKYIDEGLYSVDIRHGKVQINGWLEPNIELIKNSKPLYMVVDIRLYHDSGLPVFSLRLYPGEANEQALMKKGIFLSNEFKDEIKSRLLKKEQESIENEKLDESIRNKLKEIENMEDSIKLKNTESLKQSFVWPSKKKLEPYNFNVFDIVEAGLFCLYQKNGKWLLYKVIDQDYDLNYFETSVGDIVLYDNVYGFLDGAENWIVTKEWDHDLKKATDRFSLKLESGIQSNFVYNGRAIVKYDCFITKGEAYIPNLGRTYIDVPVAERKEGNKTVWIYEVVCSSYPFALEYCIERNIRILKDPKKIEWL